MGNCLVGHQAELSVDDVCTHMTLLGNARLSYKATRVAVATLRRNKIDARALSTLTEVKLEDMGITNPETKKVILDMVWNMRQYRRFKRMSSQNSFQVVLLN